MDEVDGEGDAFDAPLDECTETADEEADGRLDLDELLNHGNS